MNTSEYRKKVKSNTKRAIIELKVNNILEKFENGEFKEAKRIIMDLLDELLNL